MPVARGGLRAGTRYHGRTVSPRAARSAGILCVLLALPVIARANGPLTPLPGAPQASPSATAAVGDPSIIERLSRGVVTVERDGRLLGVGTVLSGDGDGRILTALSPIGPSDTADVRYADGSVVHAKVGHRDKVWDLALLVPLTGRWTDGLVASMASPADALLQAPVASRPGRPAVVQAHLRGVFDARAKDSADVLRSALDIELRNASPTIGAPVTDPTGGVVGVFVRACQATLPAVPSGGGPAPSAAAALPPCSPIVVAAPVAAIRDFLSRTPATAVVPAAWLGIAGVPDSASGTHGVRVIAIAPDSPAQKGGLKTDEDRSKADLIVAVDSQPVDTPEHLAEIISRHAVGEHVKLLVLSGGKFHEVAVVLRSAP